MKSHDVCRFLFHVLLVASITSLIGRSHPPAAAAAAESKTIFVSSAVSRSDGSQNGQSWETAYPDLQTALNQAVAGDEIWIAAGRYTPSQTGDPTISFHVPAGVTILGGFAGDEQTREERSPSRFETILDGDHLGNDPHQTAADRFDDNAIHIVVIDGDANQAETVLDGITITNGGGPLEQASSGQMGGGILINDQANLIIKNCHIHTNRAGKGGGLYAARGATVTLTETRIEENVANWGGGLYLSTPAALSNLHLLSNRARYGGGLYLDQWASDMWLFNLHIKGNEADFGGGIATNSNRFTLTNGLISGNRAGSGGAIYLFYNLDGAELINSTVAANLTTEGPGAINIDPESLGYLRLSNTILWGNRHIDGDVRQINIGRSGYPVEIRHSIVEEGWPGVENMAADPAFLSFIQAEQAPAPFGTFTLRPDSPAIDAGMANALPADHLDLDNDGDRMETTPFDLAGEIRQQAILTADSAQSEETQSADMLDIGAFEFPAALNVPGRVSTIFLPAFVFRPDFSTTPIPMTETPIPSPSPILIEATPSLTPTLVKPSPTATALQATAAPPAVATATLSPEPTSTPLQSPTETETPTSTATAFPTERPIATATVVSTPTDTPVATATETPTVEPTIMVEATETETITPQPSETVRPAATNSPTPTQTRTAV